MLMLHHHPICRSRLSEQLVLVSARCRVRRCRMKLSFWTVTMLMCNHHSTKVVGKPVICLVIPSNRFDRFSLSMLVSFVRGVHVSISHRYSYMILFYYFFSMQCFIYTNKSHDHYTYCHTHMIRGLYFINYREINHKAEYISFSDSYLNPGITFWIYSCAFTVRSYIYLISFDE
jgi:hypothetical protein